MAFQEEIQTEFFERDILDALRPGDVIAIPLPLFRLHITDDGLIVIDSMAKVDYTYCKEDHTLRTIEACLPIRIRGELRAHRRLHSGHLIVEMRHGTAVVGRALECDPCLCVVHRRPVDEHTQWVQEQFQTLHAMPPDFVLEFMEVCAAHGMPYLLFQYEGSGAARLVDTDTFDYIVLPLYHHEGGVVGVDVEVKNAVWYDYFIPACDNETDVLVAVLARRGAEVEAVIRMPRRAYTVRVAADLPPRVVERRKVQDC